MDKRISAAAVAAFVLASVALPAQAQNTRTSWLGVNGASQAPAGFCVTDISMRIDARRNVNYEWDTLAEDGVTRVGFPLGSWITTVGRTVGEGESVGGLMNMSAKIGSVWSEECLTDVLFLYNVGGTTPTPPSTAGPSKWEYEGSFSVPQIWRGANTDTNRVVGAIFTRKQATGTPPSQIVTGVTLGFGGEAWCAANNNMAPGYSVRCIGAWRGVNAPVVNNNNYLLVSYGPASKPPARPLGTFSGYWKQLANVGGMQQSEFSYKVGVTTANSTMSGKEASQSIEVNLTLAATTNSGAAPGGGASVSASVTGAFSRTTKSEITESFASTAEREQKFTCGRRYAYQWVAKATFLKNAASQSATLEADTMRLECSDGAITPAFLNDSTWGEWERCASEGEACNFGTKQRFVRYGAGDKWIEKVTNLDGAQAFTCGVAYFGSDPAYGVAKRCEMR